MLHTEHWVQSLHTTWLPTLPQTLTLPMGESWLASLLPLRRRSQTEVQAQETGVRPSMCFDFVSSHPSRVALSLSRAVRLFPPLLLIHSSFFFMEPPQWRLLFLQESCTIQGPPCPWTSSFALPDRLPQTLVLFMPPLCLPFPLHSVNTTCNLGLHKMLPLCGGHRSLVLCVPLSIPGVPGLFPVGISSLSCLVWVPLHWHCSSLGF